MPAQMPRMLCCFSSELPYQEDCKRDQGADCKLRVSRTGWRQHRNTSSCRYKVAYYILPEYACIQPKSLNSISVIRTKTLERFCPINRIYLIASCIYAGISYNSMRSRVVLGRTGT